MSSTCTKVAHLEQNLLAVTGNSCEIFVITCQKGCCENGQCLTFPIVQKVQNNWICWPSVNYNFLQILQHSSPSLVHGGY